ncbi:AAA family ATPase [Actinomycetospora sp. TBRC 11914]|uniref:ATP-binding protein n=1 Tax=Actinomycetospora sp. TBRC 11914 TaxID=2729387 RepID=UPI00145F338A|nr:LuxR family transcriptional regulator [Actinomycetospora sp. TBRC 11914]NMO93465.1 AAA family ATPase [Actinomycetospora sp. TBRC 11914]
MDGRRGAPPRRPFVGRRAELAVIDAAVAGARRGEPGIVWIAGAAGMGKSALLAGAIARAGRVGLLSATGDEAESALPYGLVDQLAAALPADLLAQYPLAGPGRPRGADPMVVGADLLAALGAVPGDDPVLVVLDDVQWADELSVRALVFVLRRLRHDRVAVLLGARTPAPAFLAGDDEPDPRWERVLGAVGGARRLPLAGLEPAELSELAAVMGRPLRSTGAAQRLWAGTHGHPLHARTLLEDLSPEALDATDVLPAPRSLAAVVLVRLARAGAATQALVVAAAVLGDPCSLADAAALAEAAGLGGVDDPGAALDEAVALGLLTERGDRPVGGIGFVHPLLRAAVHGDQPPARRRALHRAAAARVRGRAALEHRIAAASGPDPELAADLERFAADLPAGTSPLDVAELLRAAAELTVDPDDREHRLFRAVEVLLAEGEIARAAALEDDLAATRPGAARDGLLGRLALLAGRLGRARPLLAAAAGGDEPVSRAIATADLALLTVLEGRPAEAVELASGCFADPDAGPLVRRPAGLALILGLVAQGRSDHARAALDVAAGPPGARTPLHADTLVVRGVLAAAVDDDDGAEAALTEALRLARTGEAVRTATLASAYLALVRDRAGRAPGLDAVELAVAGARDAGRGFAEMIARGYAAQLHAVRGHTDEARAHLAVVAAAGAAWWASTIVTAPAEALLALVEDDAAGMLRALEPVLRPEVLALADAIGALGPRALHGEALLRAGRVAEARDASAALDARLGDRPPGHTSLDAARLRGLLAEAAGDPAAARAAFEAGLAAAAWGGGAAPLARARLEIELGRRLVTAGERRTGVDLLRAARDRLAALGAAPFLADCEELLHAAGLTPSPEEALGLTAHEDAVVALVVRGLTNREVAQELFVSPRTVAYHLSNVYAKLGVTSRAELRERAAVPVR